MGVKVHTDPQVKAAIKLFDGLLGKHDSKRPIKHYLGQLADRLIVGHANRDCGIEFIVGHKLREYDLEKLYESNFTLEHARFCIAKEHGYQSWKEVELDRHCVDSTFETIVDQMLAGDLAALKKAISQNPDLVHQRSVYPHRATLLHYTSSNGVEGYRQVVPLNLAEIVDCLLAAGADYKLDANVYGGCAARDLLIRLPNKVSV